MLSRQGALKDDWTGEWRGMTGGSRWKQAGVFCTGPATCRPAGLLHCPRVAVAVLRVDTWAVTQLQMLMHTQTKLE